jgi:hypothetical protein
LSVALDYLGLLGRTPEQAGFDWWVEQQDTNIPEVEVIGGFITSPEYHGRFLPWSKIVLCIVVDRQHRSACACVGASSVITRT